MNLFVCGVNIANEKLFILETEQNDIAHIGIGGA